jgi:hypothetical protein
MALGLEWPPKNKIGGGMSAAISSLIFTDALIMPYGENAPATSVA